MTNDVTDIFVVAGLKLRLQDCVCLTSSHPLSFPCRLGRDGGGHPKHTPVYTCLAFSKGMHALQAEKKGTCCKISGIIILFFSSSVGFIDPLFCYYTIRSNSVAYDRVSEINLKEGTSLALACFGP